MTALIIVLLIVFGIVLLLLEFLVIPGITVAAIGGILMIVGGIYMSYHHYGNSVGHLTVLSAVILSGIFLVLALKSQTWNKIMLNTKVDSKVQKLDDENITIGDQGMCVSRLAPMGQVKLNQKIVEARSTGAYVDKKTKVVVVGIVDKIVIVKPI
ncbi:NfeD family protein [Labilibaculum sp. K2S]|uniref:NfeD family protein n=1 Tax=Labilibaculum sp. K2S TaxID=3056386 RepID=UPI0025A49D67|nr:NfeD family protein [Labilibaculum sp. K2S]MDM8161332.1 NfeD family protein [Labilibaculum sp. K2S]